jgi:cell division protein FtsW
VARKLKSDRVLFMATFLLVCVSLVMVYSASMVLSLRDEGDVDRYVTKQALFAVLGIAVLAIVMRIDYRLYRNDTFVWSLVGAVGLLLVAVLFVDSEGDTQRWFSLGGFGGQPSELAKLACVLFTALFLERRMHRIDEVGYSLLPIGLVVGALALLILDQPDFGTAFILLLTVAVMVFSAGLRYRYVIGGTLALIPIGWAVMVSKAYRWDRIVAYWNPQETAQGAGWQADQSLIAVGTGGLFGRGLTAGVQKLGFLPEAHTDFIYSVIGEELGLIGTTAILICFCVIAWRGLRIALRSDAAFGGFVALGITTMIGAQAFVNMSVALNLVPTKGITLPLVSAGGSSLLVSLLAIGILLNISQHETADA